MHLYPYLLKFKHISTHTINPIVRNSGSSHCSQHLACQQNPVSFQRGTADGMKLCSWLESFERIVLSQLCPGCAKLSLKVFKTIVRNSAGRQQRKTGHCLALLLLWHWGCNLNFSVYSLLGGKKMNCLKWCVIEKIISGGFVVAANISAFLI